MAKFMRDIGHALPQFNASVDDAPGVLVRAGNTLLTGYSILNATAAVAYVQLFDAAALADVTLGTTTPTYVIGNAASDVIARSFAYPLYFALGLCIFSTTTATGLTGAAQNVSLEYA